MGMQSCWIYSALLVGTLLVGRTQAQSCRFGTVVDGYQEFRLQEDHEIDSELGRYDTVEGTITHITLGGGGPSEYMSFEYVAGTPLVVKLIGRLSDILDQGTDETSVYLDAHCEGGGTSTVWFRIFVEDINNHPPVFNTDEFTFDVVTPWPIQVSMNFEVPVYTTDADFLEANAETSFVSSDARVNIEVEFVTTPVFQHNLKLYLTDPLLAGVDDELQFNIVARNGGLPPVTQSVTVRVTRANVEPPVFTQSLYKSLPILTPPNPGDQLVLNPPILASDLGDFDYEIAGDHASFVQINPLVTEFLQLEFTADLDIGQLQNGVALIEIIAREIAGSPTPLESHATVVIFFDIHSGTTPGQPQPTTCPPPTTCPQPTTCPTTCPPPTTCPQPTTCPTTCPPPTTCPQTTDCPITCPPPFTCPEPSTGVTDSCTPCTTTPSGGNDDCEEAANIGFIIGIAVVSALFLTAVIVAVYFWNQLRRVSPNFDHLVRIDDSGLTPPPSSGIERWGDMKIDMGGTLPIVSLSSTPTHTSQPQVQAVNTSVVGSNSSSELLYAPVIANVDLMEEEEVVERPPSPKPDYRTKPDYSVKFQDAVEINPIETRHEAKSNHYKDDEDAEGGAKVDTKAADVRHPSISSGSGSDVDLDGRGEKETTPVEIGYESNSSDGEAGGGATVKTNPTELGNEAVEGDEEAEGEAAAARDGEPIESTPKAPQNSDSEDERL